MSGELFKVDPARSIYPPIEIEIAGKRFTVKPINREVLKQVKRLASEAVDGNVEAVYQQLELFLGKSKEIDQLDVRDAGAMLRYISNRTFAQMEGLTPEEKEEKKGPSPGGNAAR